MKGRNQGKRIAIREKEVFVGIDVHKKSWQVTVRTEGEGAAWQEQNTDSRTGQRWHCEYTGEAIFLSSNLDRDIQLFNHPRPGRRHFAVEGLSGTGLKETGMNNIPYWAFVRENLWKYMKRMQIGTFFR